MNPSRAADRDKAHSIQALRAIAVSLVVINHAAPSRLTGGFIGVDIFFVISGFLITGHLLKQIEAGTFGFVDFYLRRARRLLPAALTVLIVTALASLAVLPVSWRADTFEGIAASATYVVNWLLALTSVNYFTDVGVRSPVNHYWSLSVEEQFYLIWPLGIVGGLAIYRRSRGFRATLDGVTFVLLVCIVILSFVLAEQALSTNRTAAYFYTHARAWEFAAGGLAILAVRKRLDVRLPFKKLWLASGWTVLAFSSLVLGHSSAVPGEAAVPVVLATALLLVIGDQHSFAPADWLFRFAPVRWLGDTSYSLYLWHWPVLGMAPFVAWGFPNSKLRTILALLTALVLADLTRRYVEDRFRFGLQHGPQRRVRLVLGRYLALSFLVAATALGVERHETGRSLAAAEKLYNLSVIPAPCFGGRAAEEGAHCVASHHLANPDFVRQTWETQIVRVPNGKSCQNERGDATVAPCGGGAPEKEAKYHVALLGDSHAGMWSTALFQFAEREGIRVQSFLASSCPATDSPTTFAVYLPPDRHAACSTWRIAAAQSIIDDPSVSLVIVSGNAYHLKIWQDGGFREDDGAGFAALWRRFAAAGHKVLVIDDVPMMGSDMPVCLAKGRFTDDPCTLPASEIPSTTALTRAAALSSPQDVSYLSFRDVFCDQTSCHSVIGGIPAFMDNGHISAPMARSLSPRLEVAVKAALSGTRAHALVSNSIPGDVDVGDDGLGMRMKQLARR